MKKTAFFFMIILFSSSLCMAHRINVFCYVENNYIKCFSKFSTGSPVVMGTYRVFAGNKMIFEGKGDKKGNFEYRIPDKFIKNPVDLKVVCIAEMGHKNFWIVRKNEYSLNKEGEELDSTSLNSQGKNTDKTQKTNKNILSIDYNKLEQIIKITMERELAPVKRDIAELSEPKIDFRDILGGIGYVFGIMGIIFYFKSREQ